MREVGASSIYSESDVDVCLVLAAEPSSDLAAARKRLDFLAEADLVLFHQLPLYMFRSH